MDPDLPFYYHTSHGRFYEDIFMKTICRPQLSRRELLGSNVGRSRRVSFARRGARSIRTTFHNYGVDFSPTFTDDVLFEHGYASQP